MGKNIDIYITSSATGVGISKLKMAKRIRAIIVVMLLIASIGTYAVMNIILKDTLEKYGKEKAMDKVSSYVEVMETWVNERKFEIITYANMDLIRYGNFEQIAEYLDNEMTRKSSNYITIFVGEKDGTYVSNLGANDKNISDREYFKKSINGDVDFSGPLKSKLTGKDIFIISVPVKDKDGNIIRVMGASIYLKDLSFATNKMNFSDEDSYSFIINPKGQIISYPKEEYLIKRLGTIPDEKLLMNDIKGAKGNIKYPGYTYNYYYEKIHGTKGLILVTKVSTKVLEHEVMQFNYKLFSYEVVILLAVFILSGLFSKSVSRSVLDITQYDSISGLLNKEYFFEAIREMKLANKKHEINGILVISLDRFKQINEMYGAYVGDMVLRDIGNVIKKNLRQGEFASRFSGDEFVVFLRKLGMERKITDVLDYYKTNINGMRKFQGKDIYISSSIGMAMYPQHSEDLEEVLKYASISKSKVKKEGGGDFKFFSKELGEEFFRRTRLKELLRKALSNQELKLVYQPIVDIKTEKIKGFESLLRWNNEEMGFISPAEFIPMAEETGLINPIGSWVLKEAINMLSVIKHKGIDDVYASVNISVNQLNRQKFCEQLFNFLNNSGVDSKNLELEITEAIAMDDNKETLSKLETLRRNGIGVAIDDFGTGYSSISYLSRLPVNTLKVDKSFIDKIGIDKTDETLVSGIISLGKNLGLKIVAEGVESKEQLEFLSNTNIDLIQGYYYSKPLEYEDFLEYLKKNYHKN